MGRRGALVWLALAGCQSDVSITETALCDGELQRDEEGRVDSVFDADGDGYFDGNNPGCIDTYPVEQLDCDDADGEVHPGQDEIECNGQDDDCVAETLDGVDADDDGFPACEDCDDENADLAEDCTVDLNYSGTYSLGTTITYTCAFGMVNINFSAMTAQDFGTSMSFQPTAGSQPPLMSGTVNTDGSFNVQNSLAGGCTESYTMIGQFSDATHFTANLQAQYSGQCANCVNQSWQVNGTKQ